VRIWKTDRAVDGQPLRAAATHDVAIEFVKHKFRLFHRIDPKVDAERDFIAGNLAETHRVTREGRARIHRANCHRVDILLGQQDAFVGVESGTRLDDLGNTNCALAAVAGVEPDLKRWSLSWRCFKPGEKAAQPPCQPHAVGGFSAPNE
jgi:hypothetical protein